MIRRIEIPVLVIAALTALAALAEQDGYDEQFAEDPERITYETGEAIYQSTCQGCHQPDGRGAFGAGEYPALANNARLAAAAYPVQVILKGHRGMPPFADILSDEQIANVTTYIQTHFGNDFTLHASPADVAAMRSGD